MKCLFGGGLVPQDEASFWWGPCAPRAFQAPFQASLVAGVFRVLNYTLPLRPGLKKDRPVGWLRAKKTRPGSHVVYNGVLGKGGLISPGTFGVSQKFCLELIWISHLSIYPSPVPQKEYLVEIRV